MFDGLCVGMFVCAMVCLFVARLPGCVLVDFCFCVCSLVRGEFASGSAGELASWLNVYLALLQVGVWLIRMFCLCCFSFRECQWLEASVEPVARLGRP